MRVALFATCLVDLFRPVVGFATAKLLEQGGCEVIVPSDQTCCGQPAFNNGDEANARFIAQQVIDSFLGFDYVVVPSGSCGGMIKVHYPALFDPDDNYHAKALALAERCYELTQFLVDVLKLDGLDVAYQGQVTYHDSCSSLREMHVKAQPRALLRQVKGIGLAELSASETCCGFGGTFCVKYPAISTHMVNDKVTAVQRSGADTLLAGDMGCLLNIAGRLKRIGSPLKVYHIAEVLAGMTDGKGIGEGKEE